MSNQDRATETDPGAEHVSLAARERRRVRQLQLLFEGQEKERSSLAYELHEEAAQALVAVLLGLDALARECTGDSARTVKAVREQVEITLDRCRELAVGLRPPVLDGIGLMAALGSLAKLPEVEGIRVDPEMARASRRRGDGRLPRGRGSGASRGGSV